MPPELATSFRLLLGGVFAVSALSKLRSPLTFVRAVDNFGLAPHAVAAVGAVVIVALELLVGITLLSGFGAQFGAGISALLLVAFSVVMARNALQPKPLPCHCFGASEESAPYRTLGRLGLLNVAVLGMGVAPDPIMASSGQLLVALGIGVIGAWIIEVPAILALHRTPIPSFRQGSRRVTLRGLPLQPLTELRKG